MTESLRTMATDAPGTFHVASAARTYASKPRYGSRCCCAVAGDANASTASMPVAMVRVRLMDWLPVEKKMVVNCCVPNWYTKQPNASPGCHSERRFVIPSERQPGAHAVGAPAPLRGSARNDNAT